MYEKYFSQIEDMEYQAEQLKGFEVDVLDLELEMKLAKGKIKEGQFQMADMYLESLVPRFEEQWKSIKKKPMHIVKQRISQTDVAAGIMKAKAEREKFAKENPDKDVSVDEMVLKIKSVIDGKKRGGKDTSQTEIKFETLKNKIKSFNGKIDSNNLAMIKQEIDAINLELDKI